MTASSLPSLSLSFWLSLAGPFFPASFGAGPVATGPQVAGDAEAEPTSIVLTVSSNLGSEDGGAVESVVRETVVRRLQLHGLAVGERGDARMLVEIGWVDAAKDGYALRYVATIPGQPESERTSRCPRCGSDELVALIQQDVDRLRPELEVKAAPPPMPAPVPLTPPPPSPPSRRLGAMGIAGVVTLAAGFGATVPGIVLAAVGDRTRVDPESPVRLEVTSRRTPGLVLVGVGVATMIVGAVLLGVDQRRRRQRRAGAPHAGVTPFGLGMQW